MRGLSLVNKSKKALCVTATISPRVRPRIRPKISLRNSHEVRSSYYSPHRCKFNSKRQSSTLNSIQKDKKGPRFPRQIAPTRKWTHSSCISLSRESLLHTPVHPRIPAALIAAVGRVPRRWCIFYSKSTGVSHNSHMWDSRYGPP